MAASLESPEERRRTYNRTGLRLNRVFIDRLLLNNWHNMADCLGCMVALASPKQFLNLFLRYDRAGYTVLPYKTPFLQIRQHEVPNEKDVSDSSNAQCAGSINGHHSCFHNQFNSRAGLLLHQSNSNSNARSSE